MLFSISSNILINTAIFKFIINFQLSFLPFKTHETDFIQVTIIYLELDAELPVTDVDGFECT